MQLITRNASHWYLKLTFLLFAQFPAFFPARLLRWINTSIFFLFNATIVALHKCPITGINEHVMIIFLTLQVAMAKIGPLISPVTPFFIKIQLFTNFKKLSLKMCTLFIVV